MGLEVQLHSTCRAFKKTCYNQMENFGKVIKIECMSQPFLPAVRSQLLTAQNEQATWVGNCCLREVVQFTGKCMMC